MYEEILTTARVHGWRLYYRKFGPPSFVVDGFDYEVRETKHGFSAKCPSCGKRHRGCLERDMFEGKAIHMVNYHGLEFVIPLEQVKAAFDLPF